MQVGCLRVYLPGPYKGGTVNLMLQQDKRRTINALAKQPFTLPGCRIPEVMDSLLTVAVGGVGLKIRVRWSNKVAREQISSVDTGAVFTGSLLQLIIGLVPFSLLKTFQGLPLGSSLSECPGGQDHHNTTDDDYSNQLFYKFYELVKLSNFAIRFAYTIVHAVV